MVEPALTAKFYAPLVAESIEAAGTLIGGWHDVPVGPHTEPMYQVVFPHALPRSLNGAISPRECLHPF